MTIFLSNLFSISLICYKVNWIILHTFYVALSRTTYKILHYIELFDNNKNMKPITVIHGFTFCRIPPTNKQINKQTNKRRVTVIVVQEIYSTRRIRILDVAIYATLGAHAIGKRTNISLLPQLRVKFTGFSCLGWANRARRRKNQVCKIWESVASVYPKMLTGWLEFKSWSR